MEPTLTLPAKSVNVLEVRKGTFVLLVHTQEGEDAVRAYLRQWDEELPPLASSSRKTETPRTSSLTKN
jgi:hypothetical protein